MILVMYNAEQDAVKEFKSSGELFTDVALVDVLHQLGWELVGEL